MTEKLLHIHLFEGLGKTARYRVHAVRTGAPLGVIAYQRSSYNAMAFYPNKNTIFNDKCLVEITEFLQEINSRWAADAE